MINIFNGVIFIKSFIVFPIQPFFFFFFEKLWNRPSFWTASKCFKVLNTMNWILENRVAQTAIKKMSNTEDIVSAVDALILAYTHTHTHKCAKGSFLYYLHACTQSYKPVSANVKRLFKAHYTLLPNSLYLLPPAPRLSLLSLSGFAPSSSLSLPPSPSFSFPRSHFQTHNHRRRWHSRFPALPPKSWIIKGAIFFKEFCPVSLRKHNLHFSRECERETPASAAESGEEGGEGKEN